MKEKESKKKLTLGFFCIFSYLKSIINQFKMKKTVFIIACLMAVSTLQAQVAMSRYLTVKEGKMGKFMDLAAAKTKKYNSKKG